MYLSDKAWEGLVDQARNTGHVRLGPKARGVSPFMEGLLLSNPEPSQWVDTRPARIQATDLGRLEGGLLPLWSEGDYKLVRVLKFSPQSRDKTAQLAKELGITKTGRSLKKTALASEFWEAVGLSWLTPENPPPPPKFTNKPRRARTELDW